MRHHERGNAITEAAIFITVFVFLCVGLIQFAVSLITYHNIVVATREGARIASITPLIMANDSRVASAVMPMITLRSMYSNITVTNTVPLLNEEVLNEDGLPCSKEVGVTVSLVITMPFGAIFGSQTKTVTRTTTMRYFHQPLCT